MTSNEVTYGPQDPIAIVGLGARLPGGANSPQQFWKLLLENYDAITEIPKDRWDAKYFHDPENLGLVGKSIQDKGGFLKDYNIDEFDIKFFSISPREGKSLDPNQRLLLEVTYETFEDAGVTLQQMNGSRTGVFVGISATDYSHHQFPDINTIDVHTQTGVSTSINANRLSYFYNLVGPSFIVDTACSSTLVALNCACQSLRSHESDAALCGAVNVMMYPEIAVGFSKLGVLSPDGRCKAFDSEANGYVRSEGCGMVMLKRLSDAERDGNRIFAVVRGTYVDSDGHFQQQMTSPSEEQQAIMQKEIVARSGLQPVDIAYVEMHGTGTFVGDPTECRSISSVLNVGRQSNQPILIGSNKSNIGHLEPAAGIVSIIKMSLALKHNMIPATISIKKHNPNIDMKKLNLQLCTHNRPFPKPYNVDAPNRCIVQAFGFGGTNGGCVMEEYRAGKGLKDVPRGIQEIEREELIILTAKTEDSLRKQATQLADYLELHSSAPLAHVAYTLACHRTHFPQARLAFVAENKADAIKELRDFVNNKPNTSKIQTRFTNLSKTGGLETETDKKKLILTFCGQGAQWYGMGKNLYKENVVFRTWMDKIDRLLKEAGAPYSLVEEIHKPEAESNIDKCSYLQPIFFAIQVCVYKVIEAAGIRPDAIVGHSLGEIAAGYCSGALSIEDACKVVYERAIAQESVNGMGHMTAATCNEENMNKFLKLASSLFEEIKEWRQKKKSESSSSSSSSSSDTLDADMFENGVELAGHNAPQRFNLSGGEEILTLLEEIMKGEALSEEMQAKIPPTENARNIVEELKKTDVRLRRLLVNEPMHSRYVELVKDKLISGMRNISPSVPSIPLISTYKPTDSLFGPTGKVSGDPESFTNSYDRMGIKGRATMMDNVYFYESLRYPVKYMQAVKTCLSFLQNAEENEGEEGEHKVKSSDVVFLECGPHNVLRTFLSETLAEDGKTCTYVPTFIRREEKERLLILRSLAHLFSLGFSLNFKESVFIPHKCSNPFTNPFSAASNENAPDLHILTTLAKYPMKPDYDEYYFVPDLPLYAWSRVKCWNEARVQYEHKHGQAPNALIKVCPAACATSVSKGSKETAEEEEKEEVYRYPHPIVRVRLDCVNPTFQSDISTSHIPWVVDHCLQGNIVIPGVTFVECILTCGKKVFGDRPFWLRDVHFKNAFYMNKGDVMRVNISLDPIHSTSRSGRVDAFNVSLSSRIIPNGEYDLNCTVVIEAEDEMAEKEKNLLRTVPALPPSFMPSHPSQAFDTIDLEAFRKLCPYEIPVDKFFADLWIDGLELRRELRLCRRIWMNDLDDPVMSLGYIELNYETDDDELSRWGYMYPPMMDSCLQSGLAAREHRGAFFPVEARRARFIRPFFDEAKAREPLPPQSETGVPVDPKRRQCRHVWAISRKDPIDGRLSMTCCDDEGRVYGSLQDVKIQYLESGKTKRKGINLGKVGGQETPIFEHKWEYIQTIPEYSQWVEEKALSVEESSSSVPVKNLIVPANLPTVTEIKPSLEEMLKAVAEEFQTVHISDKIVPMNNRLTYAVILECFRFNLKLWGDKTKKDADSIPFTPCLDLAKKAHVKEFYHRLFLLYCKYLSDAGYLKVQLISGKPDFNSIENYEAKPTANFFISETETNTKERTPEELAAIIPEDEDPTVLGQRVLSSFPQMRPSTTLMLDVGRKMHTIIAGDENPISLIFKEKGLADAVYRDDGEVRVYNYIVQGALYNILERRNSSINSTKGTNSETLNILEVGAGTGGTTAYILEMIAEHASTTTYNYTDISQTFFPGAKQKFKRFSSFMNYQVLNIENDPIPQGFAPHSQDIVIAANVVHATSSLQNSLSNILKLLKPGGYLILLEALNGFRWLDIVFGLTDGWWALKDTDFRTHPLLTPPMWNDILKRTGFQDSFVCCEFPAPDHPNGKCQGRLSVPVAQAPMTFADGEIAKSSSSTEVITMVRKSAPAALSESTALVFVDERNVVAAPLVAALLRDGHYLIAATHSADANEDKPELDASLFLNKYCKETMSSEEIEKCKSKVHAFLFNNKSLSTNRKDYDTLFSQVEKCDLPSIVSIVYAWSLDLPAIVTTDNELFSAFEINMYAPVYLTHALIDAAKAQEDHGPENKPSDSTTTSSSSSSSSSSSLDNNTKFIISPHSTLWGVTEGVWAVEGTVKKGSVGLGQGTIWGLNRCILNETGSLHPRTVDLSLTHRHPINSTTSTSSSSSESSENDSVSQTEISSLVTLLASTAYDAKLKITSEAHEDLKLNTNYAALALTETEIALRGNKCYGNRLLQFDQTNELSPIESNVKSVDGSYALTTPRENTLIIEERRRSENVPAGCVEVQVSSAGLTSRDLKMWMRKIPEKVRNGTNIGMEFAGIVERVGEGVTGIKKGDRVFGVGKETFSSYIITNASNVGIAPSIYSMDELGGLGLELITAYYSLVVLGQIQEGDYVLIHSAAGGVGLCAVQLCKIFGAIPIVTSSSENKRKALKYMGVKYVLSSEDTGYAQECRRITNGKGVDIVLNSLPGQQHIHASMASLVPGGRFIEIGKEDFYEDTYISMRPLMENIQYNTVDIESMINRNDKRLKNIFAECSKLLCEGKLVPPLVTSYPLSQAEDAFQFMKENKHIGKVVLSPISCAFYPSSIPATRTVLPLTSQGGYVNPEGTYLVTGGTQGFSLELAIGLLKRGAKNLAVCSRSGKGDLARQKRFDELRKTYGARIEVFAVDSSSREQTEKMLDTIRSTMPPLHGIIHGAMVLHDGYIINLDHKAFWQVLAPKSYGAYILHDETTKHHDPIDFFILLSSLNVVVGTHGQANYASANMFLDNLALYRRSQGLPAMSVQWGVLGGVGYVHRNATTLGANMSQFGFASLSKEWANRVLHTCLEGEADVECDHHGTVPPIGSLCASHAQRMTDSYHSLPMGLLPHCLRPENEVRLNTHFFEGAQNIINIYAAEHVFKHPISVPLTVGVFNVKWEPLFRFMTALSQTGRFKYIRQVVEEEAVIEGTTSSTSEVSAEKSSSSSSEGADSSNLSLSDRLKTETVEGNAINMLARAIATEAANVLGIGSADQIISDVPLSQYGLDSLTAVEMKNWTEKTVHVDVPVVDFVRGPSSEQLAKNMLTKFYVKFGKPKASASAAAPAPTPTPKPSPEPTPSPEASPLPVESASIQKRKRPLTAYIFTGQSGLKKGVGMDLYEQYPKAKEIWDRCDNYFMQELGLSILKIVRENPLSYKIDFTNGEEGKRLRQKYINMRVAENDDVLKEINDPNVSARAFPTVTEETESYTFTSPNGLLNMTNFVQPVIVIYEYVALACLGREDNSKDDSSEIKINRHLFCGHSLGEYCALTSMGKIAPAHEMAMICFVRGMVMQSCVPRDPITHMTEYGMAAVSPLRVGNWFKIDDLKKVISIVVNSCGGRMLQIVNYNVYNDQYVVSGEKFVIWHLGMTLDHIYQVGEKAMKDLDTFCYVNVGENPHSATPIEIPRSKSVMPLAGIDMPFHSHILRKVVPLFRSFLDSRLPKCSDYDYYTRLVGKFITNTYSRETFSTDLHFARKIIEVTHSPILIKALGVYGVEGKTEMCVMNDLLTAKENGQLDSLSAEELEWLQPSWVRMTQNEKARLLLRESLSYQFASPVQWIDAQNTLMKEGVLRVVEIGPAKTLSTMFSKSLRKLNDQGKEGAEIHQVMSELFEKQQASLKKKGAAALASTLPQGAGVESLIEVYTFEADRTVLEKLEREEEE